VSSDVFVSPLVVKGPIVVGDQRGRQLGFPTANITMTVRHADIADGVYAGYFTGAGLARAATAVSVGRRMTFHTDGERLLEAHVLDFDGDLYGYFATVELVSYIRPQRRFDGVESLVAQLRDDVASVRRGLPTSAG
jgi:FAD synthase